jgi:hypothetical protein
MILASTAEETGDSVILGSKTGVVTVVCEVLSVSVGVRVAEVSLVVA